MATKYDHSNWFRLSRTGGVLKVTMNDMGVGQGNDGVSLPCKGCFVQVKDGDGIWIESAETQGEGVGPWIPGSAVGCQPIWIPVSDVAQLYFQGSDNEVVDIVYLLG